MAVGLRRSVVLVGEAWLLKWGWWVKRGGWSMVGVSHVVVVAGISPTSPPASPEPATAAA